MHVAQTLRRLEEAVATAIEEAIAFAKSSPRPQPEDALLEVFAS